MQIANHGIMHVLQMAHRRYAIWCDMCAVAFLASVVAWHGESGHHVFTALVAAAYLVLRLIWLNSDSHGRVAMKRLRQHNARMTTALDHMSQGLCMFDADKNLIVSNAQYARLYGLAPELMKPGTSLRRILEYRIDSGMFMVGDPESYIRERIAAVEERRPSVKVQQLTDGRSIAISHAPLDDGGWVATHDDISEIRRIEAQMSYMAHHDGLTDLPNRVLFREEMDRALERSCRGDQMWLLCLDLDQFKPVNDTLGHPAGDALLKQVAQRLRAATRGCDIVARLGGDEFAILQGGVKDAEKAKALAERIIESVSQPYDIDGHQAVISTSIGIAVAPNDSTDADQLFKMADMALYRAKTEGSGRYCFFEPEMDERIQARRALELDLRRAVQERELRLHYQPFFDIETGRISGFEALLRWSHPTRGDITPREFVPLAEEIGLMGQIGSWVLKEACAEAAKWPGALRLAVNLSPVQFRSRELVLDVVAALGKSRLPADRLELEITETVLLQDTGTTLAILNDLRDLGVNISLDDFGARCSSLNFLRKFSFDKIKIDQSFIQDLADDPDALAIVRAVSGLGRSIGIATTAEGVETAEQLAKLREEGCAEVQGYLFSRALVPHEIGPLLSDRNVTNGSAA